MIIERFDELFKILNTEYGDYLVSVCSYLKSKEGVEDTPIIATVPDFSGVLAAKLETNYFSFSVFPALEGHNLKIWIRDIKPLLRI